jgi:restriction system protein
VPPRLLVPSDGRDCALCPSDLCHPKGEPYPSAVTVPDFQTVMRPILAALGDGEPLLVQVIRTLVADALDVSDEDQKELLASGKQTRYSNRIGWALTHMARAGLVERPARAQYAISARGKQVLAENPERVDMNVLFAFPEYQEFRTPKAVADGEDPSGAAAAAVATADLSRVRRWKAW